MKRTITGVILAGGKSSRMGTDKALLELEGRPIVAHVASILQMVFDKVILVASDALSYRFLGLEIVGDVYQNCGPLGGIHSGLVHAVGSDIFVSACDTPLITIDLIRHIANFQSSAPARIASLDNHVHPLCGLYTQNCLPVLVGQLESRNLRVLEFTEKIEATVVPISPDLAFYRNDLLNNFNTPEDYSRRRTNR